MNKIKEFRKNKRISQSYIAKIMEVKQNTVSQWETGEIIPGTKIIDDKMSLRIK